VGEGLELLTGELGALVVEPEGGDAPREEERVVAVALGLPAREPGGVEGADVVLDVVVGAEVVGLGPVGAHEVPRRPPGELQTEPAGDVGHEPGDGGREVAGAAPDVVAEHGLVDGALNPEVGVAVDRYGALLLGEHDGAGVVGARHGLRVADQLGDRDELGAHDADVDPVDAAVSLLVANLARVELVEGAALAGLQVHGAVAALDVQAVLDAARQLEGDGGALDLDRVDHQERVLWEVPASSSATPQRARGSGSSVHSVAHSGGATSTAPRKRSAEPASPIAPSGPHPPSSLLNVATSGRTGTSGSNGTS